MTKSFQREAFDQWLSKNKEFFLHPPVIVKNRKNSFTMCFQGISSAIECHISSYDYSIFLSHKGRYWELFESDIVSEQQTPSGEYFCEYCKPEYKKLFPTRFALWEDHIFKPILTWVSNNCLNTKWICLFQLKKGESSWAQIVVENSIFKMMQDEDYVKVIPVTENQVMPVQKAATTGKKKFR